MSANPSCIVHEFPIPDREYYAASVQWDEPVISKPRRRPAPSRVRQRKRRSLLLPLALIGLALFAWGFLLGRAGAAGNHPSLLTNALFQSFTLLPEEPAPAGDEPSSPAGALSQPFTFLPEEPEAAGDEPSSSAAASSPPFALLPEEPEAQGTDPVRILTVPGAIISSEGSGQTDVSEEDWRLILVNASHPLPDGFQIPKLTQLRNGHAVDSRAYPDLQRMMDDCRAAGLEPLICSSYRSWEKQEELFEKKVQSCMAFSGSRAEAEAQAAEWVSRPGTSEHQAGLALDIVDKSYQMLDEGQEKTAVQQWLIAHCAEYGFILRYPTEKSALTGVGYEPWHYRYVGAKAAQEIMDQGLCLEEYINAG